MSGERATRRLWSALLVALAMTTLTLAACSLAFPVDDYKSPSDAGGGSDAGVDAPADAAHE